jgi:hypothetical protein
MKAATIAQLKKEFEHIDQESLKQLCLRLARFKMENKELLTYALYYSDDETAFVQEVRHELDQKFVEINTKSYFYIKKSVRKILKLIRKYARYSNSKSTEVELLIYFCEKLNNLEPCIFKNNTLTAIYNRQLIAIETKLLKLHEDLQYDFRIELNKLRTYGTIRN